MTDNKGNAEKKEQFINKKKNKSLFIAGAVVVAIMIVTAGIMIPLYIQQKSAQTGSSRDPVAAPRSYIGKVENMKTISPTVENGKINISLAQVDELNIAGFEMENNEGFLVPMMVFITTSGRLFAGSSLCECGGREFSLAGKTVVCDTCRTTYDIETRKYISGVSICGKYPPVNMKSVVENGTVIIDESLILNFRPRIK